MADQTKIICIGCPKGCSVYVEHEGKDILNIEGYGCQIGEDYAKNEFTLPKRVLTSTVKLEGGVLEMLPVKTKEAVPKDKLFDCAKVICGLVAKAPVTIGTVICSDICGTGVDLVATRDVASK